MGVVSGQWIENDSEPQIVGAGQELGIPYNQRHLTRPPFSNSNIHRWLLSFIVNYRSFTNLESNLYLLQRSVDGRGRRVNGLTVLPIESG